MVAPSRPPKGHRVDGGCAKPPNVGKGLGKIVRGRRGVALPRSTQAPCSIRSVSIGPQFLPRVTCPQSSIATRFCTSAYY